MKELQQIFTEMLNHIDEHKEAYNKPQWTNEAIVKTWIKTNEHKLKNLFIPIVSENKPMDDDYPLIPMKDIDDEARIIAVRWHENATDWIGDKHKLASDIMNYARRKFSANAR